MDNDNFSRNVASPALPPEDGVIIRLERKQNASGDPIVLRGVCKIAKKDLSKLVDSPLHNVSIVCTYGPNHVPYAFPLVRSQIVLQDDLLQTAESVVGYFNVVLNETVLPPYQGDYWVLACFHNYLSDVIAFKWSK